MITYNGLSLFDIKERFKFKNSKSQKKTFFDSPEYGLFQQNREPNRELCPPCYEASLIFLFSEKTKLPKICTQSTAECLLPSEVL